MMYHLGKKKFVFLENGDSWVGNVNTRMQKFMKKVDKNGGFRFMPSSFLHNTQHIIFIV